MVHLKCPVPWLKVESAASIHAYFQRHVLPLYEIISVEPVVEPYHQLENNKSCGWLIKFHLTREQQIRDTLHDSLLAEIRKHKPRNAYMETLWAASESQGNFNVTYVMNCDCEPLFLNLNEE